MKVKTTEPLKNIKLVVLVNRMQFHTFKMWPLKVYCVKQSLQTEKYLLGKRRKLLLF